MERQVKLEERTWDGQRPRKQAIPTKKIWFSLPFGNGFVILQTRNIATQVSLNAGLTSMQLRYYPRRMERP
ncbi:MAG: hypothetical protein IJV27_09640 [Prevotella sp.]|nr:hypothetical protein [Prevotella sp.]